MADLELDGPNSAISVDTLKPKTGTTLTLGESGDTITLGSGATSTGFGETYNGAVNWDTTAKTTAFTAVSGTGYFVNTTSGAITATLPATPSAGDIVAFKDYAATFNTNALTIARNGSNIQGLAINNEISTIRASVVLVYVDATKGWLYTSESNVSDFAPPFIQATGGTITTSGDFKIHTFTSSGTFTVSAAGTPAGSTTVDYLVVAGGGSGGGGTAGGGGAGGYRESFPNPATGGFPISAQAYPITVGGGGSSATQGNVGNDGSSSIFSTITSSGGGGGGDRDSNTAGRNGGSGGGGGGSDSSPGNVAGSGNTPSVSPPQGQSGGAGRGGGANSAGGGGGGHAATGTASPSNTVGGAGGNGSTSTINASPVTRAGGGGGGGHSPSPASGGSGGGGAGGVPGTNGTSGTANTGGAGGGGGQSGGGTSGAGGSGIVIIRYKFQ